MIEGLEMGDGTSYGPASVSLGWIRALQQEPRLKMCS